LEHFRQKLETLLTQLTDEAENWAVSGEPLAGESITCMGPKSSLMYYGYSKQAELAEDLTLENSLPLYTAHTN
jgi:hypothetical protein